MFDVNKLKTAGGAGYVTGRAPQKAIALLAMARLQKDGQLDPERVDLMSRSLREAYNELWSKLGYARSSNAAQPLFHLISDGVYELKSSERPKTLKALADREGPVKLSVELRQAMQDGKLAGQILSSQFFSADQVAALKAALQMQ